MLALALALKQLGLALVLKVFAKVDGLTYSDSRGRLSRRTASVIEWRRLELGVGTTWHRDGYDWGGQAGVAEGRLALALALKQLGMSLVLKVSSS